MHFWDLWYGRYENTGLKLVPSRGVGNAVNLPEKHYYRQELGMREDECGMGSRDFYTSAVGLNGWFLMACCYFRGWPVTHWRSVRPFYDVLPHVTNHTPCSFQLGIIEPRDQSHGRTCVKHYTECVSFNTVVFIQSQNKE